jgi:uncharacterized membrane protein
MDNQIQILIKVLGIWYSFISLPALAIVGVAYFRKYRTNGGLLLGCGAVAAAVGSIFNKLFPWQSLLSETQFSLPYWAHLSMSIALGVHLLGLNAMVIGLVIITFGKEKKKV